MKFKLLAILAALAAMSAPLAVQAKDDPQPIALSGADQALVDRSIARGDMLYAYDQAAWHGTDDLQEKAKAAGVWDKLAPTLGGWIVDGSAAEPVLVFLDKSDRPQAVYTARFADNGTRLIDGKLLGPGDDRSISPARMKFVVALRAARAEVARAKFGVCTNAAAMFITHLLDPVPTEIHVFTMRAARLPLFVATTQNNRLWSIERIDGATRIRAVELPKK